MARRDARTSSSRARTAAVVGAVGVLALLAGVAVAGLPEKVPDDVVLTDIAPTATTTTLAAAVETTGVSTPSTASATTVADSSVPRTDAESTVVATTSSTSAKPSSAPSTLAPFDQLSVVVANAGGTDGMATRTADSLRELGYANVTPANAVSNMDTSVVLFGAGLEREGRRLAEALSIADVQPQPDEPLTVGEEAADLWVMIGFDQQLP